MSDSGNVTSKTLVNATLDELLVPKLGPGQACLIVIRGRSVGQMLELKQLPAVLGRAPDVDLPIDDIAVSRRHAQVEQGPEGFSIRDLDSTNGVFVNGLRVRHKLLRDGDRIQVGTTTILKFCFQDELEASFQRALYDSATRDSLTGLYNRRFFIETLEADFSYAQRNQSPLSLLLLDLDHFKKVNDGFGHAAGDGVLCEAARLIQRGLRVEDIAARQGGEEFAVLLRHTDAPRAYAIAERIRQSIEEHRFEHEGRVLRVTVSIGLATLEARSYESWRRLIEAADGWLYKAKQNGRNCTQYVGLDSPGRLREKTVSLAARDLVAHKRRRRGRRGKDATPPRGVGVRRSLADAGRSKRSRRGPRSG